MVKGTYLSLDYLFFQLIGYHLKEGRGGGRGGGSFEIGRPRSRGWKEFGLRWTRGWGWGVRGGS